MKEIVSDKNLVAYCGLYCGACSKYLNEKCGGCHVNDKASWCAPRTCCISNSYSSCADCKDHASVKDCKKFDNVISKIFSLIFRSDRAACVSSIRKDGLVIYADQMAAQKIMTIKK